MKTLLVLVVAALTSASTSSPLSKPINDFTVSLFDNLAGSHAGENVFVSPYSVSTALSILLLGARSSTRTELRKGLGFDQQQSCYNVPRLFHQLVDSQKNVSVSNYLLVQKEKGENQVLADYKSKVGSGFRAEVEDVDFAMDGNQIVDQVNNWVKNQTHGLISSILEPPLDASTKALILNAIYFKGKWQQPFTTRNTRKQTFYNGGDDENGKETDFMVQAGKRFPYTDVTVAGQAVQALEMPYQEGGISMTIFLPKEQKGLQEIISSSSLGRDLTDAISKTADITTRTLLNLYIPKFKIETSYDLVSPLADLGIKEIFTPDADLSGINGQRNLIVDQVKHKAYVRVYEEGTEAAAVTSIGVRSQAVMVPMDPPVEFVADHPFLFLIKDKTNDVVLFIGTVETL